MGIGSLRRYHKPQEVAKAPDVEPGTTETDEAAELAAEANRIKLAEEQQAQAEAANSHPNTTAATPWQVRRFPKGDDAAEGETLEQGFETRELAAAFADTESASADSEFSYTVVERDAAESVNPIIQEAGGVESGDERPTVPTLPEGVESQNGAEHSEIVVSTPVTPGEPVEEPAKEEPAKASTSHGDVERPTAGSSTADWLAYAKADPGEHGLDLTPRTGLRDLIAAHYLGEK